MKYLKLSLKLKLVLIICSFLAIWGANALVEQSAAGKTFNTTPKMPHNKVGLLLGTSKILANGRLNLYYKYRIDAAVQLFKARKIDFILVSGDNSRKNYDESTTMKNDLVSRGIPTDKIYLDYAGFRTLDSVVRSKEIFGQQSITVISQPFHNERAIYIANNKGIKAVGFNAKDVSMRYGMKVQFRERLARVKMVLDLVFGKQPKYLGKKITIQ